MTKSFSKIQVQQRFLEFVFSVLIFSVLAYFEPRPSGYIDSNDVMYFLRALVVSTFFGAVIWAATFYVFVMLLAYVPFRLGFNSRLQLTFANFLIMAVWALGLISFGILPSVPIFWLFLVLVNIMVTIIAFITYANLDRGKIGVGSEIE